MAQEESLERIPNIKKLCDQPNQSYRLPKNTGQEYEIMIKHTKRFKIQHVKRLIITIVRNRSNNLNFGQQ